MAEAESPMGGRKGFGKLNVSTQNTLMKENAAGRSGHEQPVRLFLTNSGSCLHSTKFGGRGAWGAL